MEKIAKPRDWLFGEQKSDDYVAPCDYVKNLGISTINLDDSPHIICAGKS